MSSNGTAPPHASDHRLIDFKNHVDTKVRLQRLTLLVGPNGAGKTGVLQGIDVAAALIRTSASTVLREKSNTNVIRRD
jgi:ABC-type branched-subunit amino acid transport system ATPase component